MSSVRQLRSRLIPDWGLLALPPLALVFVLTVDASAAIGMLWLLLGESINGTQLVRFAVLVGLALLHLELGHRVERVGRYLVQNEVVLEPTSVWAVAALLTLPPGWAASLTVVLFVHALIRHRQQQREQFHRTVLTGASLVVSVILAAAVLGRTGAVPRAIPDGVAGSAAVLAAMLTFTVVNFILVLTAIWLSVRPSSVRVLLPPADAFGYEAATIVLGLLTALVLLHSPLLTPLVLVLVVSLNRSLVVSTLHRASRTDAKTGLPTLQGWTEHAERVLARAARAHASVAVLFCDLDHFKRINDGHGHLVGDQVLVAVAHCLRRELREYDGLGRFGGEEFVAVVDGPDGEVTTQIAQRLRAAVADLTLPEGLTLTVSIGVAHHGSGHGPADLTTLLERADRALRVAKTSGRNQVSVAAPVLAAAR